VQRLQLRAGHPGVDVRAAGVGRLPVVAHRADHEVRGAVAVEVGQHRDRDPELVVDLVAEQLVEQRAVDAGVDLHDALAAALLAAAHDVGDAVAVEVVSRRDRAAARIAGEAGRPPEELLRARGAGRDGADEQGREDRLHRRESSSSWLTVGMCMNPAGLIA
jgi:hypothetical protein